MARTFRNYYNARMDELNNNIFSIDQDSPKPCLSSTPGYVGRFKAYTSETQDVYPGKTVTWYVFGPPGDTVKISLTREDKSGGHNHPNDSSNGPSGRAVPKVFQLGANYPQNVPVTYTAPFVGGIVKIRSTFSSGGFDDDFNRIVVPDLVPFSGGIGIVLTGATSKHSDNHFGLSRLNSFLQKLGARFYQKFNKEIFVNDMSLPNGGLFDISGSWRPPHKTHQDGRRVDIHSQTMSEEEKTFFVEAAKNIGFRKVDLEDNPEHWHLEI